MSKFCNFAYLGFSVILLFGLIIRVAPLLDNNFYFTMDQGNDAVHVREILRGYVLLRGPETGIEGVYHGPLWYYFIAIGYFLWDGHPVGAVLMLVILNLALTLIIMLTIWKKVSYSAAIIVGFALQIFWWFYEVSRYAFNPFPIVFLAFILIFLLISFWEGNQRRFIYAAIPVGLAFHCESAAGVAFFLFYSFVAFVSLVRKKLYFKNLILSLLLFCAFLTPRFISEIDTSFSESRALVREFREPAGVFAQSRHDFITARFKGILTRRITPQSTEAGLALLGLVSALFIVKKRKALFTKRFVLFSVGLVCVSFVWFGSNLGWQIWHTVYIRPLLLVTTLLMALDLPRKIGVLIVIAVIVSQGLFFKTRYLENLRPNTDASILANEIAAVDWVYRQANYEGFYVYSYLPSVYDYPYQYLFWWYGRKEYGYVPCEYSTFKNIPSFFVPSEKDYQSPKKRCQKLRFLVVEPDKNAELREKWLVQLRENTKLLDKISIGQIIVEKRKII